MAKANASPVGISSDIATTAEAFWQTHWLYPPNRVKAIALSPTFKFFTFFPTSEILPTTSYPNIVGNGGQSL